MEKCEACEGIQQHEYMRATYRGLSGYDKLLYRENPANIFTLKCLLANSPNHTCKEEQL